MDGSQSDDRGTTTLASVTRQWVMSAHAGDAKGFARLYEHIAPAVFTWAKLRMRPESRAILDPADLVQEVWLRAWRKIDDLDVDRTPFRFWVFRIAKNVMLEATRQARRPDRRAISGTRGGGDSDPLEAVADSITAVSRRVARSESLERFHAEVEALPEDDRALVVHCGLEGLPLKEVGARLGISEEAAGKRWQRLRARLRTGDLPRHLLSGD